MGTGSLVPGNDPHDGGSDLERYSPKIRLQTDVLAEPCFRRIAYDINVSNSITLRINRRGEALKIAGPISLSAMRMMLLHRMPGAPISW